MFAIEHGRGRHGRVFVVFIMGMLFMFVMLVVVGMLFCSSCSSSWACSSCSSCSSSWACSSFDHARRHGHALRVLARAGRVFACSLFITCANALRTTRTFAEFEQNRALRLQKRRHDCIACECLNRVLQPGRQFLTYPEHQVRVLQVQRLRRAASCIHGVTHRTGRSGSACRAPPSRGQPKNAQAQYLRQHSGHPPLRYCPSKPLLSEKEKKYSGHRDPPCDFITFRTEYLI